MGLPCVSIAVVVRFCTAPCATTPFVPPLAKAMLIDLGGQLEKYPADEDDCAIVAVITVVPGCSAVMIFVVGSMEATAELPLAKLNVPTEFEHSGSVADPGAQISVCVPFKL